MTDVYVPGIPSAFRLVPEFPTYAVTEMGEVLNVATNTLVPTWRDSDEEEKIVSYALDYETLQTRRVTIKVSDMVKSAFAEEEPMRTTTTDSATTAGVRPQLFNHGNGDHESSPSCSTCYLGFEASPEELRRLLWMLAVEFSEEVDATPSALLDEIRESVLGVKAEDTDD